MIRVRMLQGRFGNREAMAPCLFLSQADPCAHVKHCCFELCKHLHRTINLRRRTKHVELVKPLPTVNIPCSCWNYRDLSSLRFSAISSDTISILRVAIFVPPICSTNKTYSVKSVDKPEWKTFQTGAGYNTDPRILVQASSSSHSNIRTFRRVRANQNINTFVQHPVLNG